jgi:hypothetical protein
VTDKGTVVVDLAGWIGPATWARATDAARRGATDLAVAELLGAKRRQVLAGRGADGAPMARRKHARRDGATGPVLAPHRVESRSIRRLRHSRVGSGRVVIWWGDGWSRILSYHGRGLVRHAPVRNVVDFTPATLARVRRKVLAWWGANGEEGVRVGPVAPKPPAQKPPPPPPPPKGAPILPGRPIAERLAAWTEGDRLIERVRGLTTEIDALKDRRIEVELKLMKRLDEQARLVSTGMNPDGSVPPEVASKVYALQNKIDAEQKRLDAVVAEIAEAQRTHRRRAVEILKTDRPGRFEIAQDVAKGLRPEGKDQVGPLDDRTYNNAEEARSFVANLLRRGDTAEDIEVQVAQIVPHREQRAYYSWDRYVALEANGSSVGTAVHEFGHAIEEQLTERGEKVLERSLEFLAYRVGGEPHTQLNKLYPDSRYRDDERGRKDKFDEAFGERRAYYVGKDYGRAATEILSMGLQELHGDPVRFAEKDPEYFKFVVGILRGDLR